jgi:hypothetical protein
LLHFLTLSSRLSWRADACFVYVNRFFALVQDDLNEKGLFPHLKKEASNEEDDDDEIQTHTENEPPKKQQQQQKTSSSSKQETKKDKGDSVEAVFEVSASTKQYCSPNYLGLCVIGVLNGSPYNEQRDYQIELLKKVSYSIDKRLLFESFESLIIIPR